MEAHSTILKKVKDLLAPLVLPAVHCDIHHIDVTHGPAAKMGGQGGADMEELADGSGQGQGRYMYIHIVRLKHIYIYIKKLSSLF